MKVTKIFTIAAVALGATLALSGCIRETFPKESAITKDQLMGGQMDVVAENLLKGIPAGMLAPALSGWEHTDFGFHSVGCYNDHASQLICTNGWLLGNATAYNRFYLGAWGMAYGPQSIMGQHVWYNYYPQIKSCNDVIALTAEDEDLAVYGAIARTYRAMYYIDLARMFECLYADAPKNSNYESGYIAVQGLTVPIVDETLDEQGAKNNPRATREEMFTFIFNDLAIAEAALANYTPQATTDPTLAVVYGLYARAYMWLGGFEDGLSGELPEGVEAYKKAAEYSRLAIDTFGGAIMTENEWTNPVTGFNTKASSWMWYLTHSTDTVPGNLHQFTAHMSPEAAYGYCPLTCPGVGSKYFDRLSNTDFRKRLIKGPETTFEEFAPYTLITDADEFNAFAPYTFFKFRPGQGQRTDYIIAAAIDMPLMRCEEMYFIEMEAVTHTQGTDAGWALLTQFMLNRDPQYICPTSDIVDEIIFQKSIEFWGEGIIMYDLKRLDKGVQTGYKGTNYDANRRFNTTGRVPWWTYCIPQGETQLNQAIDKNNPDPSQSIEVVQVQE